VTHVTKRRVPYMAELPHDMRQRAVRTVMRQRHNEEDMWNLLEHLGLVEVANEMLAGRIYWWTLKN
jgi:hypothetical protein